MDDIIALVCPSCGGKIQVEKTLEKMFCTHCGTQLLLRQGAEGLLTPFKARDLNASAQLKETQNALMVNEVLQDQVRELEESVRSLRKAFFQFLHQNLYSRRSMPRLKKTLEGYQKSLGLDPQYYEHVVRAAAGRSVASQETGVTFQLDALVFTNTLGCNTAEDLLKLHQFLTQPQYSDRETGELAAILQPITRILPELKEKKEKLKKTMERIP